MAAPVTWANLKVFEPDIPEDQADAMIATTWARIITKVAPCLGGEDALELTEDQEELVRGIVRDVVLRWYDSGSGAVSSHSAGDYSETLGSYGGGKFRPDEISDLQDLCSTYRSQSATTIPTGYGNEAWVRHADWCSINFVDPALWTGTPLCDCGAELTATGLPLWTRDPTP